MCWPSRVAATAYTQPVCPVKVWTSVPSTWYSRTSLRLGPSPRPTTHAASAAMESTVLPSWKVRSTSPSIVISLAVWSVDR